MAVAVNDLVKNLSNAALPFLGAMAAIGALSMALIQAVKNMFPVLRIYQQGYLTRWLENKALQAGERTQTPPDAGSAERDLIELATAGDAKAFYELAIEQLCGQMNAAAQIVLQYPEDHPDLLRCLASLASVKDLDLIMNRDLRRDLDTKLRARAAAPDSVSAPMSDSDRATAQDLADARTRVTSIMQRSIDGLQIASGSRWKFFLQFVAFALSAVIVVVAVILSPASVLSQPSNLLMLAIIAIVAGFLAPVARDLVASIEQLHKP